VTLAAPLVRPVGAALAGGALAGSAPLLRPFNLSSRITYTRTGPATGVTATGLVYEVAADVPRFAEAGRLIGEGQRTNLEVNGKTVGRTGWTNIGLASAVAIVGPDGLADSATRLTEDTATSRHETTGANFSVTNGVAYAATIWVRPGAGARYVQISGAGGVIGGHVNYDLTGAGAVTAAVTATGAIRLIGSWYLLTFLATASSTSSSSVLRLGFANGPSAARLPSYLGTGAILDASFADFQAGTFASSTIPTTGTAATRGADTGIFSLFGSAGTIAFSAVPGQAAPAGVDQTFYSINNGADADRLSIVNVAGGNSIVLRRVVGGAVTDSAAIGTQTPGTLLRGVLTWSGTTASAKLQGGTWRTQTSTSGGFTLGRMGNIIAGSSPLFGTMGWGDLLPRSVSEAEADAIMARIPA
jgi:hypothetical protein